MSLDSASNLYMADGERVRVIGSGNKPTPTLGLTSSSNPSSYGNSVTFTASISNGLTGTVTFYNGATTLGTGTISGSTATYTTSTLVTGTNAITATWVGNSSYNSSFSGVVTQVVNPITTPTISVSTSGSPSTWGSTVTFTATVTSGDTNQVTFYNGGTAIGTATPSSGSAVLTTSALPVASNSITATIAAGGNYSSATSSAINQVVNQATPTISISDIPSSANYGGSFTATYSYSGNGSPTESISSSTTSVCTVSGNSVNYVGVGTCTLTASATATTDYTAVTGNAQSFSVGQATPTISISDIPSGAVYAGNFTVAYSYSGNGSPTVSSSTTSVCTVSGNSVNYVGVGTCTLTASAAATTDYTAVTGSPQSFSIGQATPTISVNSSMFPNGYNAYAASFTVTYSYTGNGSPTVSSSTPGICTVSGNTVTNVGVMGNCTLTASAAATSDYTAVTGSPQSFYVYPDQPTISISDIPSSAAYSWSGAGFTVTYSYIGNGTPNGTPSVSSSTPSVCSVSGNSVTYMHVGTCTLQATATATTDYEAPISSPQSFTISQGITTVSWGTPAPITYGTALSGTQLYATTNPNGLGTCTFSPPSGTVLAVGSHTLTATCTPDDTTDYTTPAPVNETLVVNQAPLTVSANSVSRAYNVANPTFTPSYSGFENGDTQSVLTGSPSLTTTATTSSPIGTYPINVAQGTLAAANYSFTLVNGTLTINVANPTITWATPSAISYGTPLSSTQLNASFSAPGTCVYYPPAGTVLTIGAQTLTVDCVPTDTVDYTTPPEQTVSLTVNENSSPTIWISDIPTSAEYGGNFAVTYSYNGNGTPSVTSNTTSVCTVSGNIVTYVGLGTCSLTASASGTSDDQSVQGSAQTFTVTKAPPPIWVSNIPYNAAYPGSFTATYDYPGTGTPSLATSTSSVCTVSGNTVTYVSTGVCTLTASAPATTDDVAATGEPQSFSISQTALTEDPIYTYSVSYDNAGNVTGYSDSADNGTATIMGTWTFQYDALNRLVSGTASAGTYKVGSLWDNLCWSYDSFGNRTIESLQTSACSNAGNVASTLVFNASNQLSGVIAPGGGESPSTLTYDAAGDVTQDTGTNNQYLYDAEGRICAFQTPNGLGGTTMMGYLYDGDGIRVAKGTIQNMNTCDPSPVPQGGNGFQLTERYVLGPGGEELTMLDGSGTWQRTNVFGGGRQVATFDMAANPAYTSGSGLPTSAPALHFQIVDALGTRRMQTNADGQPETDIQSLPFGDGLMTSNDQYAPVTADDATPLHFTGKERDSESGNDYFGARYYASTMGRFLSPDWSAKEEPVPYAKMDNPQSLNLYAYVRNNPLARVDPDGHTDPPDPNKPPTPKLGQPGGRQLDPNSEECKALAKKIDNLATDIQKRDFKISTNPNGLPELAPPGSAQRESVAGHVDKMKEQIDNLGAAADLYNNKCGGGPPPSPATEPQQSTSSASLPPGTAPAVAKVGFWGAVVATTVRVLVVVGEAAADAL